MKPRWSNEQLDALLDRGGLGASRRETILEEVLAKTQAPRPTRRWPWTLASLGFAAVAATSVLLLPRISQQDSPSFRPKGALLMADKASPSLECLGATTQDCPSGSLLLLRAPGVTGYLSAWARPMSGGERIWYFSGETALPLAAGTAPPPEEGQRAVRIGPEHALGSYEIEIRVTKLPMSREQLLLTKGSEILAEARIPLTVVAPR